MESEVLRTFFKAGRRRSFAAGELIMDGTLSGGAFYIDHGYVKVYSISDEGDQYVHIIYKAGEIFPFIWILRDIRRRVFYEAISETVVYEADKEDYLKELKKNSKLSYESLLQQSEQFYIYADRLDNLQYKSAYERVIYRLLFMAGRFGGKQADGILIELPLTHELIAESINLARESVSRQIEKLEKLGLISYQKGHILIKDAEALSREFSEPISLNLWGLSDSID